MKFLHSLIFITLMLSTKINPSPGCMDTSNHNVGSFDTKTEHYVTCYCPCREIIQQKNLCLECGHIRYPQGWYIVGSDETHEPVEPVYSQEIHSVEDIIHQMIELYTAKKAGLGS